MRLRERSSRENRRFSSVEKRPEDFFHGQLASEKSARPKKARITRDSRVIPAKPEERAKGLEPSTSSLGS